MEECKKKRCAVYTRKSVEDGLDMEFNSLDAQREAGVSYIASQKANGWVCLPDRYDDGGFSGGNTNRPALQRLLADCEAGKIDIIVVYKIDRLSRSICDFADLSKKLDKWNVAFVSVTQEINTHTSAGRMMLNILMTFAQFEREVIAERVRDKMAASRRKGKWVGGTVPFGYRAENRKLVPEEAEAVVVNRIFARYMEVQSPKLIASELNDAGVLNRNGRKWDTQSIHRILTNRHYIGEVEYQGAVFKGEHQGIVARDVWDRCRELMTADPPRADRTRNSTSPALLQGILHCGHCGCAMTPALASKGERKYLYYVCTHHARHPEADCPIRQLPAGEIEAQVLTQLRKVMCSPEITAAVSRQTGLPPRDVGEVCTETLWEEASPGERQRLAQILLASVTVHPDRLSLELRTAGLKSVAEAYSARQ